MCALTLVEGEVINDKDVLPESVKKVLAKLVILSNSRQMYFNNAYNLLYLLSVLRAVYCCNSNYNYPET